jgi:type II secretory ATPase GspE/PulE/Tfp pilus assembly ATPase PilB-like protein
MTRYDQCKPDCTVDCGHCKGNPPKLLVELVPRTCWYSNVRTNVSAAEWNVCKRYVRDRSGDRCEICGGVGARWPVECHEIWEYDDTKHVQRLADLIALCPPCHEVKHIGRAEALGNLRRAERHLMAVNGWTNSEVTRYLRQVFDLWAARSLHNWTLDISMLTDILGP